MKLSEQLDLVKCAISGHVHVPPQKLKFDHPYGGFVWHTEDDDTYYAFVMCITHKHKTEWVVMSDEPRLYPAAVVEFTMTFPVE